MAVYRVAIIGRTGQGDYGHGLDIVWNNVDNVKVVAVADPDDKGRAEAAKRVSAAAAYADYRAMLEKERPQIVSVAARWLDYHRELVLACAEFGCHMFVEKPMALTLAQADEMVAACEAKHLKIAIAHQARYSPRMPYAQELIAGGKLGQILELRGRGKEDQRGGGEDMMVLGTHIMDLMRLLGGNPSWCSARVLEKGAPIAKANVREGAEGIGPLAGDEIHAMFGMAAPAAGFFGSERAKTGAGTRWGLNIYGEKGVVTIGGAGLPGFPSIFYIEDPSWSPAASKSKWIEITSAGIGRLETAKDLHPQNPANALIAKDLIHAIETDTQPKGSMYDGRAALEMIMAVYESQRLNAAVSFPLKNREHPLKLL